MLAAPAAAAAEAEGEQEQESVSVVQSVSSERKCISSVRRARELSGLQPLCFGWSPLCMAAAAAGARAAAAAATAAASAALGKSDYSALEFIWHIIFDNSIYFY